MRKCYVSKENRGRAYGLTENLFAIFWTAFLRLWIEFSLESYKPTMNLENLKNKDSWSLYKSELFTYFNINTLNE